MALHWAHHCVVNPFQVKLTCGRPVVTLLKLYKIMTRIGSTR